MKYLLIFFFSFHALHATQSSTYETSLYTGTLFLFLLLGAIALVQMRRASQDKLLLQDKEEKILVLSKVYAEKEQEHLHKELALEKEILKLIHSNESLELKLKEGTKNQVVTKIEELQNKRQTVQDRLATHV